MNIPAFAIAEQFYVISLVFLTFFLRKYPKIADFIKIT